MAEIFDPNKFITLLDVMRAASSAVGPTRRGPASSWDVPQAMSEPVVGQRPTPNMPAALRDAFVSRPVEVDPTQFRNAREPQPGMGFGPPEATNMRANINQSGPIGALQSLINGLTTRGPENASMRAAAGNGVVPNANVSGTYTPPDPTNLDIYGPGIVLPGGNVLGGVSAEERAPRRPETLPSYSVPATAAATAPRGNGIVPNADVIGTYTPPAPKAGDVVGSPIDIVRGLQRTNYLPVMDARGRVSYQSEGFIQEQAAKTAATEKARADLLKTKAGTAKDLSLSIPGQIQEYFFNMRKDLQSRLATLPENDARRTSVTKELERLDAILAPKTPFFDAATAAALGRNID